VAVNQRVADSDTAVAEADEVAIFAARHRRLSRHASRRYASVCRPPAFDIGVEQARIAALGHGIGAIASFTGLMRDTNEGDAVSAMTLEHYPGMTESALTGIIDKRAHAGRCRRSRWSIGSAA
jgi:hypothetical protein